MDMGHSPTTPSTIQIADKFIICVSQYQALFDKENYKNNDFKDFIWQSNTDRLG